MFNRIRNRIILILFTFFIVSAACGLPTAPLAPSTQESTFSTQTAPSPATEQPNPNIQPTTAQNTSTPEKQTQNPPTETATVDLGISSANVASLTAGSPIDLPEWPQKLIWPPESVNLPGNPSPRPVVLTNNGEKLYPVVDTPPGVGSPILLPLNGNFVMAFANDGSSLVVQDPSQTGLFTIDGQKLWIIPNPQQPYGADYSSDGRFLAVTWPDQRAVTIYETASGNEIKKLSGFETAAPVYSAIIAPGGKIVAWYARATLQFQDVTTGELGDQISFEDFIGSILFHPDGSSLAVVAAGKLMIYDTQTSQESAYQTLSEPLRDLKYSPNGKVLVGIYGQSLQFWDGKTLAPITNIPVSSALSQLSISLDGKQLITVSDDQKLVFWSLP